jgi:hypothetical protein
MPKASEAYNLHVLRPDLAMQWHPTRNGVLGPKDVTPGSRRKVWWLCEHGHWWSASVLDRVRGKRCTYCGELQKQGVQAMADVMPVLLREWHPSRNQGIMVRKVLCTHPDKLWWLCERGHEWQATVKSRLAGRPCPFCSSLMPEDFTGNRLQTGAAGTLTAPLTTHHSTNPAPRKLLEQASVNETSNELRRSKRYVYASTVMVESDRTGVFGYAQINNYSASGMLIRSDFPMRPGTLARIRLETPLYASASCVVESRVVWCREIAGDADRYSRFGIGVSLL